MKSALRQGELQREDSNKLVFLSLYHPLATPLLPPCYHLATTLPLPYAFGLLMQGEKCHLRSSADSRRQGAAQADVDVECLTAFVVAAIALWIGPAAGGEAQDTELHCMGVTAQRQGDIGLRQNLGPPVRGVVAEQDAKHALGTGHCLCEASATDNLVNAATLVLDTDDRQAVRSATEHDMLVQEYAPSQPLSLPTDEGIDQSLTLTGRQAGLVGVVVVVAEDAEHAVASPETGQGVAQRLEFVVVERDEVAGKDDEVGQQVVNGLHHAAQLCLVSGPSVHVEVADLNDAVAFEGWRQKAVAVLDGLDLEAEPSPKVTVAVQAPTDGNQYKTGPQEGAPGEVAVEQAGSQPAGREEELRNEEQEQREDKRDDKEEFRHNWPI